MKSLMEYAPPVAAGGVFFVLADSTDPRKLWAAASISAGFLCIAAFGALILRTLRRGAGPFSGPVRSGVVEVLLLLAAGTVLQCGCGVAESLRASSWFSGQRPEELNGALVRLKTDPSIWGQGFWIAEASLLETFSSDLSADAEGEIQVFGNGDGRKLTSGDILVLRGRFRRTFAVPGEPFLSVSLDSWSVHGNRDRMPPLRSRVLRCLGTSIGQASPDTSSYLSALLLGRRTDPGSPLMRSFRNAGCAHLLALSGFHLGMIALLAGRVLRPIIGFRAARIGALVPLFFYLFLVGLKPSLVRAALMYGLWTVSTLQHRKTSPVCVLASAFLLQILLFPGAAREISFRLSYLALLGILSTSGLMARYLNRILPESLSVLLAAGIGAQAFTLPLVVSCFGTWRPIGIIASPLLTPLLAASMGLGSLAVVVDLISGSATPGLWPLCDHLVSLIERLSTCLAAFPGLEPEPAISWLLGGSIAIIPLITVWRTSNKSHVRTESRFPGLNPCVSRQSGTCTQKTLGAEFSYKPGCPGKNHTDSGCGTRVEHLGNRPGAGCYERRHSQSERNTYSLRD